MRDRQQNQEEIYYEASKWWLLVYWTAFGFFAKNTWSDVCRKGSNLSMRLLIQALSSVHALTGVIAALLPGDHWLWAELSPGHVDWFIGVDWLLVLRLLSYLAIPFAMMHCYIKIGYQWASISSRWGKFFTCVSIGAIVWTVFFLLISLKCVPLLYPVTGRLFTFYFVTYYLLAFVVDFCCWWIVLQLWRLEALTVPFNTAWWVILQQSPLILEILAYNFLAMVDTLLLLLLHLDLALTHLISQPDYALLVLFSIRYVTILGLLNPIARTIETSQAQTPLLGSRTIEHRSMRLKRSLRFRQVMSRAYDFESGVAMIICNSQYPRELGLASMHGNNADAKCYENAFKFVGYAPETFRDVQGAKLLETITTFLDKADTRGFDGFALAYTGHGNRDSVMGTDGVTISIQDICERIKQHKSSRSGQPKPKILIFDCCRGGQAGWIGWHRMGTQTKAIVSNICPAFKRRSPPESKLGCRPRPLHVDFLICYSTTDGFFGASSVKDASSPFARSLSVRIEELATCELKPDQLPPDITDALRFSIGDVSRGVYGARSKQCLFFETSLSRRFELRVSRSTVKASTKPIQPNQQPPNQSTNHTNLTNQTNPVTPQPHIQPSAQPPIQPSTQASMQPTTQSANQSTNQLAKPTTVNPVNHTSSQQPVPQTNAPSTLPSQATNLPTNQSAKPVISPAPKGHVFSPSSG